MMRVSEQPAYILHRYAYGESSLVLECLTQDHGRLGVLARGARRGRSGSRLWEPFVPLILGWSGRGELPLLTQGEALPTPEPLSGRALWCGFYVNELVLALLHRHDAYPGVYKAYRRALAGLGDGARQDDSLRLFELALLQELGYGLILETEVEGKTAVEADRHYTYVLDFGPVPERSRGGIPVSGSTLLALAHREFPDESSRRQARILLQAALARHLRMPLRTPAVFRQLRRSSPEA